jgi:hypothetical protein
MPPEVEIACDATPRPGGTHGRDVDIVERQTHDDAFVEVVPDGEPRVELGPVDGERVGSVW